VNQEQGRQRQDRSSSASKRQRTGTAGEGAEWQEQRHRGRANRQQHARPPVIKGASGEFAELAGPAHFWVGRCRPELDETKIEEMITKCAQSCDVKDFKVESVKCLTKDPNPWTRSFKVSVPARFEEAMKNPLMYLETWEARPFTPWPSRHPQGLVGSRQGGRQAEAPAAPGAAAPAAAAPAAAATLQVAGEDPKA